MCKQKINIWCVIRNVGTRETWRFILICCWPSSYTGIYIYTYIMQHTSHATRWTVEVCTSACICVYRYYTYYISVRVCFCKHIIYYVLVVRHGAYLPGNKISFMLCGICLLFFSRIFYVHFRVCTPFRF